MKPGSQLQPAVRRYQRDNHRDLATLEGRLAAVSDHPVRSMLITSGRQGEGKTTVSVNAACGLAHHAGARVLLVDGNLGSSRLTRLFGLHDQPGLTDLLAQTSAPADSIHQTAFDRVSVLPRGTGEETQLGRRRSHRLRDVLQEVEAQFEYVLYDADAAFHSSDVALLAPILKSVAVVVSSETTRWGTLEQTVDTLNQAGGTVLGVIMNRRRRWIPQGLYENR